MPKTLDNKFFTYDVLKSEEALLETHDIVTYINGIRVSLSVHLHGGIEYLHVNGYRGLKIIPMATNAIYIDTEE